ncbi:MAG: hypothetical protein NTV23_00880 [Propionibacteriales bacterium]|nr:hypothetical protein [Propionibacteriales bacterium]
MSSNRPPDDPAPGDLQRVVDDLEATLLADPESLAAWRSVFAQLASEPFDPTGPVVSG